MRTTCICSTGTTSCAPSDPTPVTEWRASQRRISAKASCWAASRASETLRVQSGGDRQRLGRVDDHLHEPGRRLAIRPRTQRSSHRLTRERVTQSTHPHTRQGQGPAQRSPRPIRRAPRGAPRRSSPRRGHSRRRGSGRTSTCSRSASAPVPRNGMADASDHRPSAASLGILAYRRDYGASDLDVVGFDRRGGSGRTPGCAQAMGVILKRGVGDDGGGFRMPWGDLGGGGCAVGEAQEGGGGSLTKKCRPSPTSTPAA